MARRLPIVQDGVLLTAEADELSNRQIAVGTAEWFAWLENADTFAFDDPAGRFTARKKRRSKGVFWYAVGQWAGRHRERYLGKSATLDLAHLRALASSAPERPRRFRATDTEPQPRTLREPVASMERYGDPILRTKLEIPPVGLTFVAVARGLDRLSHASEVPFTVVTAPAGYGKTTMLAYWARRPDVSAAWVTLDARDNDPVVFWSHVAAALAQYARELEEMAQSVLRTTQPQAPHVIAAMLIAGLTHLTRDIVLVLDNYQVLDDSPAIHGGVSFFVEHLPRTVHVVLATRAEPPLPVAKWRAYAQLQELSTEDLALNQDESARYLRDAMELSLSEDDVNALYQRTEGWITSLQLAARAIRERPNTTESLVRSLGEDRRIVEYVMDEVVSRIDEDIRTFLFHVILLDRLSPGLCDAITQSSSSQTLLTTLERAHLFLIRMDERSQWYRFHSLFASAVRQHVRATQPSIVAAVYPLAATWCLENGQMHDAIEYTLASGDVDRAASLLDDAVEPALEQGTILALAKQIERLPDELIRQRARLCVGHAFASFLSGNRSTYLRRVNEAVAALAAGVLPTHPEALAALQAEVQTLQGSVQFAFAERTPRAIIVALQQVLTVLPSHHPLHNLAVGFIGFAQLLNGDLRHGQQTFSALLRAGELRNDRYYIGVAALFLGLANIFSGRLGEALDVARRGQSLLGSVADSGVGTGTHLVIGRAFYQRNQLETARDELIRGSAVYWDPITPLFEGMTFLAHVQAAQGDAMTALRTMDESYAEWTRAEVHDRMVWAWSGALIKAYQAHLWLLQGDITSALDWVRSVTGSADGRKGRHAKPRYVREVEQLVLARANLAQGKPQAALDLLQPLRAAATRDGWVARLIEVLVLQALAHSALHDDLSALSELKRALELAARERFIRVFLDGGFAAKRLIVMLSDVDTEPIDRRERDDIDTLSGFVTTLLEAFEEEQGGNSGAHWASAAKAPGRQGADDTDAREVAVELTPRERQVLNLLAQGRANKDLARELGISLATVKHHVQRLFRKLDVQSRTQAIAQASALHLLEQMGQVEVSVRRMRDL
jgi:LuxR family maltose regulon positive regulatory protein